MECIRNRVSYASWRLTVFRQLFLSSSYPVSSNRISRRELSSSNGRNESPQDFQIKADIRNTRDDTEKESKEASFPAGEYLRPSQLLPQSPLLTRPRPGVDKKRKKRPTQEDVDRLRLNPWAMALASPPRMCIVTGTRVPREFLTDWGLVQRRGEEGLWFMPVGLLQDELSAARDTEGNRGPQPEETRPEKKSLRYLTLRIINRLPLLKGMTGPFVRQKGGKRSPMMRLIPFRWKHPLGPLTLREEKRLVWREDMPEFVLERMRKQVLKQLKELCTAQKLSESARGSLRIIEVDDHSQDALLEALKGLERFERMECGAVLVMGPQKSTIGDVQPHVYSYDLSQSTLPEFVSLPQVQSRVPVFDLSELFSQDDLMDLRSHDARFEKTALFLSPDEYAGVQAILALWKLKALLRPNI